MTYATHPRINSPVEIVSALIPAGPEQIPARLHTSDLGGGVSSMRLTAGRVLVGCSVTEDDTIQFVRGNGPAELPLWAGHRLRPGRTIVVAPHSPAAIRLPAGASVQVTSVPLEMLDQFDLADDPSMGDGPVGVAAIDQPMFESVSLSTDEANVKGLAPSIGRVLRASVRTRERDKIDSSEVVWACLAYVNSIGSVPTVRDLCMVSFVSERRLRTAFTETLGMPPTEFFRYWQLSRVHDVLVEGRESVTTAAMAHGVRHLGRFAGRYRAVFSEYPNETLSTALRQPAVGLADITSRRLAI